MCVCVLEFKANRDRDRERERDRERDREIEIERDVPKTPKVARSVVLSKPSLKGPHTGTSLGRSRLFPDKGLNGHLKLVPAGLHVSFRANSS